MINNVPTLSSFKTCSLQSQINLKSVPFQIKNLIPLDCLDIQQAINQVFIQNIISSPISSQLTSIIEKLSKTMPNFNYYDKQLEQQIKILFKQTYYIGTVMAQLSQCLKMKLQIGNLEKGSYILSGIGNSKGLYYANSQWYSHQNNKSEKTAKIKKNKKICRQQQGFLPLQSNTVPLHQATNTLYQVNQSYTQYQVDKIDDGRQTQFYRNFSTIIADLLQNQSVQTINLESISVASGKCQLIQHKESIQTQTNIFNIPQVQVSTNTNASLNTNQQTQPSFHYIKDYSQSTNTQILQYKDCYSVPSFHHVQSNSSSTMYDKNQIDLKQAYVQTMAKLYKSQSIQYVLLSSDNKLVQTQFQFKHVKTQHYPFTSNNSTMTTLIKENKKYAIKEKKNSEEFFCNFQEKYKGINAYDSLQQQFWSRYS